MISIIILNYNSSKDTIVLYNSIKQFNNTSYHVLIIDNASDIEEKELLIENIAREDLILNKFNKGYAYGNTVGLKVAIEKKNPFVLILNPDIRIEEKTIIKLVDVLIDNSKIAAVGPRICYRKEKDKIYSDGGIIDYSKGLLTTHLNHNKKVKQVPSFKTPHNVDYVNGSVFLARTSVFIDIGFMLEDFFLYFEETEWCLRAKSRGYSLMVDSSVNAYHMSSNKGIVYAYYMTRNRILLSKYMNLNHNLDVQFFQRQILKQLRNCIKNRNLLKDRLIRAKIKGFISGYFGQIRK